jgi:hypothetical protein
MIELGQKGKDQITGFEGIITGRATYMYGCDQYCLSPEVDKDGKIQDGVWFDEGRIKITGNGVKPEEVKADKPGGPQMDAPRCI